MRSGERNSFSCLEKKNVVGEERGVCRWKKKVQRLGYRADETQRTLGSRIRRCGKDIRAVG